MASHDIRICLLTRGKPGKRDGEDNLLQIAQQLIAKFEQLVGSAAAREFT